MTILKTTDETTDYKHMLISQYTTVSLGEKSLTLSKSETYITNISCMEWKGIKLVNLGKIQHQLKRSN